MDRWIDGIPYQHQFLYICLYVRPDRAAFLDVSCYSGEIRLLIIVDKVFHFFFFFEQFPCFGFDTAKRELCGVQKNEVVHNQRLSCQCTQMRPAGSTCTSHPQPFGDHVISPHLLSFTTKPASTESEASKSMVWLHRKMHEI